MLQIRLLLTKWNDNTESGKFGDGEEKKGIEGDRKMRSAFFFKVYMATAGRVINLRNFFKNSWEI